MAIRIEARIEPNVTIIEHNLARIPRLHPNNDPNVNPNRDEYGRMRRIRHRITRIRHSTVGFGSNSDPNYSLSEKTIFPEVYMGVQELYSGLFGLFACILLCIRMAIRMDSRTYLGHSGQIRLYLYFSGLFGWMIRVDPQLTLRISPNLPRMPRTPPRIRSNSIRIFPEYGPKEICWGHIRDHILWYFASFEHFKTNRITPRMRQNPSRIFAHSGREGEENSPEST